MWVFKGYLPSYFMSMENNVFGILYQVFEHLKVNGLGGFTRFKKNVLVYLLTLIITFFFLLYIS